MDEENMIFDQDMILNHQDFRLKDIDETRIISLKKWIIKSKKHRKVCTVLYYIWQLLILFSAITECVSSFLFVSLVGIPIVIASSAVRIKNCERAAEIKKV